MKKCVLWFLILSAFLLPAALYAGEAGGVVSDRLRAEAGDPNSNVVWMMSEKGDEIVYLDKKELNENGKKVVLGREKVQMMQ